MMIVGDDRIAVDVVGASVVRAMGSELLRDYPIWSHRQIRRAVELGLGACGPGEVEVLTEDTTGGADFAELADQVQAFVRESDPGD